MLTDYGYHKNDHGKWETDPEAAHVVKLIFQMAIDGLSKGQIRNRLFKLYQPTPREYMQIKKGKDIDAKCIWRTGCISDMLINEQYIGCYVAGKYSVTGVGSKRSVKNDKAEWIFIPDHHPPIICKDDFARVQVL